MRRIPFLGVLNGEALSESPGLDDPGLDELTWARLLGCMPHAIAGASFQPSSRTLKTFYNTEPLSCLRFY